MTKRCFALFAAIAVICVSVPVATANDVASVDVGPVFGEQPAPPQALQTHGPAPAALRRSCPSSPWRSAATAVRRRH